MIPEVAQKKTTTTKLILLASSIVIQRKLDFIPFFNFAQISFLIFNSCANRPSSKTLFRMLFFNNLKYLFLQSNSIIYSNVAF